MHMLMDLSDTRTILVWVLLFWLPIGLFTLAVVIAVVKLTERRIKRRKEYAGTAPSAEEIAYLNGGADRAVRAALAAQDHDAGGLRKAVAEAHADGRMGPALLTPAVRDAIRQLQWLVREKKLADVHGMPTADGVAALRDARDQYAHLWPGYKPNLAASSSDERAMAVAVFGDAVLDAVDPALAAAYPLEVEPA